jgi:hypothetical protein
MATRYSCEMKRFLGCVGMLAVLAPDGVFAQSAQPDAAQQRVIVALDAADCRRLLAQRDAVDLAHQPRPDVEYRPGRDVDSQGRPVTPADLPGANPLPLTGPLTLPLGIRLEDLLGSRTPPNLRRSELEVARIAIDPMSGRLAFNGQPLERPAEDAVTQACGEYLAGQSEAGQTKAGSAKPR